MSLKGLEVVAATCDGKKWNLQQFLFGQTQNEIDRVVIVNCSDRDSDLKFVTPGIFDAKDGALKKGDGTYTNRKVMNGKTDFTVQDPQQGGPVNMAAPDTIILP